MIFRPKNSYIVVSTPSLKVRNAAIEENKDNFWISPFKVGTTNKVWRCQYSRTILRKSLEATNRVTRQKRSKIESKERSRVAVFSSLVKLSIRVNIRAEIYIRYVKPGKIATQHDYHGRFARLFVHLSGVPVSEGTSGACPDHALREHRRSSVSGGRSVVSQHVYTTTTGVGEARSTRLHVYIYTPIHESRLDSVEGQHTQTLSLTTPLTTTTTTSSSSW